MARFDFITPALNVTEDRIETCEQCMISDIMHIRIKLQPSVDSCIFCGGPVRLKDYGHHSFNHLPVFGYPLH